MPIEGSALPKLSLDTVPEATFYIPATGPATRPRRALKHDNTFAVLDSHGDIGASAGGTDGLFNCDTRFLSHFELLLNGMQPLLLGSNLRDDNTLLTVDLTNPDMYFDDHLVLPKDTLHVVRTIFLWRDTFYQRLAIQNHGDRAVDLRLTMLFDSDFADLFEVRGLRRERRGTITREAVRPATTVLSYEGLDAKLRQTVLHFDPTPSELTATTVSYRLNIAPKEFTPVCCSIGCGAPEPPKPIPLLRGLRAIHRNLRAMSHNAATVETSNDLFNEVLCRSMSDLYMLMTKTPQGPYPYAGIPWYSTTFGRDGLITALQMLWLDPRIAQGVLRRLAALQATTDDPASDAQPGKILHEMREGEMAALREVPFGLYYGTVDATPLFVMLAGLYAERTGDDATIVELWPAIEAALAWIDGPGDPDGDGFIEYYRATEEGLANQGWKDSQDAIFHADGHLAEGPIALAEVQGYVYSAKLMAARCAKRLGRMQDAHRLKAEADLLAERFDAAFWCPDLGTYALALDGKKQPCRVRSSNAGQVLFTGIAQAGAGARGRRRTAAAEFLFRLGHPHHRQYRSALQSDVVSQRIDLAARQRADRARARALRPQAFGRARVQGLVRRRHLHGDAPVAGIVLRLPARPRPRPDALPRRLLAAGLGQRHALHADRGLARPAVRSRRERNPPAQSEPAVVPGRSGAAQPAPQGLERRPQGAPPRQRRLGRNSRAARRYPGLDRLRPQRQPRRERIAVQLGRIICMVRRVTAT